MHPLLFRVWSGRAQVLEPVGVVRHDRAQTPDHIQIRTAADRTKYGVVLFFKICFGACPCGLLRKRSHEHEYPVSAFFLLVLIIHQKGKLLQPLNLFSSLFDTIYDIHLCSNKA